MRTCLIMLIITTISVHCFSQKDNDKWNDGFIIIQDSTSLKTDSLFGKIKMAKNIGGYEFYKIKFSTDTNVVVTYQARDIIGFQVGNIYFESICLNDLFSFAERIVSGELNLFRHKSTMYTSSPVGMGGNASKKESMYIKRNNTSQMKRIPYTGKKFIKEITSFTADNSALTSRINNKELKYKDLEQIVEIYNSWYILRPYLD